MESHLLQMRGLKPSRNLYYKNYLRSHLLQMRGLKQAKDCLKSHLSVASFTDAWIETR